MHVGQPEYDAGKGAGEKAKAAADWPRALHDRPATVGPRPGAAVAPLLPSSHGRPGGSRRTVEAVQDDSAGACRSSMPIKSYLAHAFHGRREELARALRGLPGCAVLSATNQDLVVLVTDTADGAAEQALEDRLGRVPGLQCLT